MTQSGLHRHHAVTLMIVVLGLPEITSAPFNSDGSVINQAAPVIVTRPECCQKYRGLRQRSDGPAGIECPVKPKKGCVSSAQQCADFATIDTGNHRRRLQLAFEPRTTTFKQVEMLFCRLLHRRLYPGIKSCENPQTFRLEIHQPVILLQLFFGQLQKGGILALTGTSRRGGN